MTISCLESWLTHTHTEQRKYTHRHTHTLTQRGIYRIEVASFIIHRAIAGFAPRLDPIPLHITQSYLPWNALDNHHFGYFCSQPRWSHDDGAPLRVRPVSRVNMCVDVGLGCSVLSFGLGIVLARSRERICFSPFFSSIRSCYWSGCGVSSQVCDQQQQQQLQIFALIVSHKRDTPRPTQPAPHVRSRTKAGMWRERERERRGSSRISTSSGNDIDRRRPRYPTSPTRLASVPLIRVSRQIFRNNQPSNKRYHDDDANMLYTPLHPSVPCLFERCALAGVWLGVCGRGLWCWPDDDDDDFDDDYVVVGRATWFTFRTLDILG